MIIQCEQCRTKFKLDDSKVPDKGVKVRCAKCKSVFSVTRELQATAAGSSFESMLETSVASEPEAAELQAEYAVPEDSTSIEFSDDTSVVESVTPEELDEDDQEDSTLFEVSEDSKPDFAPTVDNDEIEFLTSDPTVTEDLFPSVPAVEPEPEGDLDFGSFAFNEEDETLPPTPTESFDFGEAPKSPPPSEDDGFGGLDFSDDDMFGTVATTPPEEAEGDEGFDFGMDDFASSMGVEDTSATQKSAFAMTDSASESPFSLDEIDFGDELTSVGVQHVNPEELKPSQELLFAPLAEAQNKPSSALADGSAFKITPSQEELPPLPIASRRKQSPFMSAVFVVCGIVIAAALSIYGFSMFSGGKGDGFEGGQIAINNVEASFVKNKLTGELIVISGEAVNNYRKPRASIKVRGVVYDAKGDEITSKAAFCGNPLTVEQLATMTMEQIEAAMANQFGDSLANMEVPPGKSIPFVIVLAKPASGAKDYGVESAGSTVASVKQQ